MPPSPAPAAQEAGEASTDPGRLSLSQLSLGQPLELRHSKTNSSTLLKRILTSRAKSIVPTGFNSIGGFGLNTLYSPSDPKIEYVFVHGLGGGSTKTWCLNQDPSLFWPKEWLPHHPAFRNVRIHSFGYNSNWAETGASTLDVHDFGAALLLAMRNSECFTTNQVVFVAHSMGGLVVKEMYMLARQDPLCQTLAESIAAMVFLATPHRGSDYSTFLNNMLRLSAVHHPKQYIADLNRCSPTLARINNTFRHHCDNIILYSYFESRELTVAPGKSAMIVQKDSAVMGLPRERVSMMNADHRSICKFQSPDDSNYMTLTDAFSSINRDISSRMSSKSSELYWEQLRAIESYLGMPETPEDDLKDLDDIRMEGSCEWFIEKPNFQAWIATPPSAGTKLYWVHAKPATGKSVLASHVIDTVKDFNNDCSYYFFRHGDKIRSTLAGCLLSIAYQMAVFNMHVRNKLLVLIERGMRFEKDSAKNIWRRIFEPILSGATTFQPQFWILDALDECADIALFFGIFSKLDASFPIKIFVTSRRTEEIAAGFAHLETALTSKFLVSAEILAQDTRSSISLYLENNKQRLHVGTEQQRQALLDKILDKSQGCFLWVRLVLDELSTVWTIQQFEQVLEDVPPEMDLLYSRAVHLISAKPAKSVLIASAILAWTVCAIRPMTVSELQAALELDIGTNVQDPEQAIPSLCSQLVHVDRNDRVLMVHLTAKTFLQNYGLDSPLSICPIIGHQNIARVCLEYLISDEMRPLTTRRAVGRKRSAPRNSAMLLYASFNFAEHVRRTTSNNQIIGPLLYELMQKNIFSWIEVVAQNNNLDILPRTANLLKNYFQRHSKYFPPLGEQIQLADSWSIDLHRLVTKFGASLARQPASIHSLVPPFCPRSSAVHTVFGSPAKRITVVGLEDTGWDDRLACIDSHDTQAYAVAAGEAYFAIGFGNSIILCHAETCQKWKTLDHQSPLRHLGFDQTGNLLISIGRRDIKVWDLEGGSMRHRFCVNFDILSFNIQQEERGLHVALKNDSRIKWDLRTGEKLTDITWECAFEDEGQFRRPPLLAAFSPDDSVLAVAYRGRPIMMWDLENDERYGFLGRENRDLDTLALGTNTSPSSLVFNVEESLPLLAAAYEDGDLCLFDYDELTLVKAIEAHAQIVACSPNGTILATGNAAGMVQLLEFETLQLLFRVNAVDYGIRYLAFNSNSTRFMDVRGTQCNVWEPALPSGASRKDDASSNWELQEPRIVGLPDGIEITSVAVEKSGSWFFAGKSDGSVWLYQTSDGKPVKMIYRHGYQISVNHMIWGDQGNLLVTADAAGHFIVCSLGTLTKNGYQHATKILNVKGDVHNKTAISQILFNKYNTLLLVSTVKTDTVWDLDSLKVLSSYMFTSRPSFDWVNNPLNDSERILVGTHNIGIWDWATCTLKVPEENLKLDAKLVPSESKGVKCVTDAFKSHIVVEYSEQHGESSATTNILLLNPKSFVDGQLINSSNAFESGCSELLHLIGTVESRIIFIDKRLCICSLELLEGATAFRYINHCFIPADWYSQRRTLRTRMTSKGDILFVRTEEVAVIKNGLLFEEEKKIIRES